MKLVTSAARTANERIVIARILHKSPFRQVSITTRTGLTADDVRRHAGMPLCFGGDCAPDDAAVVGRLDDDVSTRRSGRRDRAGDGEWHAARSACCSTPAPRTRRSPRRWRATAGARAVATSNVISPVGETVRSDRRDRSAGRRSDHRRQRAALGGAERVVRRGGQDPGTDRTGRAGVVALHARFQTPRGRVARRGAAAPRHRAPRSRSSTAAFSSACRRTTPRCVSCPIAAPADWCCSTRRAARVTTSWTPARRSSWRRRRPAARRVTCVFASSGSAIGPCATCRPSSIERDRSASRRGRRPVAAASL